MSSRPWLSRCRLEECEALCCYDGVYLSPEEAVVVPSRVRAHPAFFSFLPRVYLLTRREHGVQTIKTATRPYTYRQRPAHFADTRCVFALDDGRCSLQVLSVSRGQHPWADKPSACWMHPLRHNAQGILPPPASLAEDPDRAPGYPGYTAATPCGMHRTEGRPWSEVLREELDFFAIHRDDR